MVSFTKIKKCFTEQFSCVIMAFVRHEASNNCKTTFINTKIQYPVKGGGNRWQENAKSVVKVRQPAATSATPTDIQREDGTPTSRLSGSRKKMARYSEKKYAQDASAPAK
jgi:hypothetical protein